MSTQKTHRTIKRWGSWRILGYWCSFHIFAAKESPFARFHANQGLVLLIAEAAYGIAVAILSAIFLAISLRLWLVINTILGILWIAFAVWAILGIVNAAQGEMKPLPIIGGIKILK